MIFKDWGGSIRRWRSTARCYVFAQNPPSKPTSLRQRSLRPRTEQRPSSFDCPPERLQDYFWNRICPPPKALRASNPFAALSLWRNSGEAYRHCSGARAVLQAKAAPALLHEITGAKPLGVRRPCRPDAAGDFQAWLHRLDSQLASVALRGDPATELGGAQTVLLFEVAMTPISKHCWCKRPQWDAAACWPAHARANARATLYRLIPATNPETLPCRLRSLISVISSMKPLGAYQWSFCSKTEVDLFDTIPANPLRTLNGRTWAIGTQFPH